MATIDLTLEEIRDLAAKAFSRNGCDGERRSAGANSDECGTRRVGFAWTVSCSGYVASLRSGKANGKARPAVARRTPAIIHVDGDYGYAPLALEKGLPELTAAAKEIGVAVMAINRTHHFAALWPKTEALAEQGLIGMACVCYTPMRAPAGGNKALFGTDPLSFAWPRPGGMPVVFDMATAAKAMGEVMIAERDGEMVPEGTGLDAEGRPTTDPDAILKGMLLPFGGYKGSAVALMVELLAAGAVSDRFSFEAAEADNKEWRTTLRRRVYACHLA